MKPINTTIQTITDKLKPKSFKELKLYLGAVNQINRCIPHFAQLCFKLQQLLKRINYGHGRKTPMKLSRK